MNPFAGLGASRPAEPEKPRRARAYKPPQTGWIAPTPNPWGLSGIQCEVVKRLAEGMSSKAIAAEFGLSSKTIDSHMDRIKVKMGVDTRTHAVVRWVRHIAGGTP